MSDFLQESVIGLALTGLFIIMWLLNLPWASVAGFFALAAGLYHAYLLGKRLAPHRSVIAGYALGLLVLASILACIQTIWFYAGGLLGSTSDAWTLVLACLAAQALTLWMPTVGTKNTDKREPWTPTRTILGIFLFILSCLCAGFVLNAALAAATTASIRTPWQELPLSILPAIGLTWLAGLISIWKVRSRQLGFLHAALGILSVCAIAPVMYRIGYGFDGFLHLVGEQVLASTGTLLPHPPYYIGQYVFVTWLARLIDLPNALALVDRWLVPLSAALVLPLCLALGEADGGAEAFIAFILLPLGAFIATTPQSFAYVLGLAALLLARGVRARRLSWRAPLVVAAWAVAIHPLAGIPFFLLALALCLNGNASEPWARSRNALAWVSVVLSALAIPLVFAIIGSGSSTHIDWNISRLLDAAPWQSLLSSLAPWIGRTYSLWPGWSSLIEQALPALLFTLIVLWAIRTKKDTGQIPREPLMLTVGAVLLCLAAAGLKTAGDFAFLIDYERGNYADRLVLIATFCLWVAAIPAVIWIFDQMRKTEPVQRGLTLWLLCAVATGLAYDALPRNDALIVGHGWSVGAADIEAVRAIDHDAGTAPYTVLADQSVSAAAVSQLGFKRYAGDVFFYPIPTGGPLYSIYLDIAAGQHVTEDVTDAGKMGQSSIVYVVINDYWWQADQVEETLGQYAETNWTFGDPTLGQGHADYVYKFDLTKLSN